MDWRRVRFTGVGATARWDSGAWNLVLTFDDYARYHADILGRVPRSRLLQYVQCFGAAHNAFFIWVCVVWRKWVGGTYMG